MKRTKILFIHHVGYRGGAATMLANIIAALDKSRFDPIVVCPAGDGNEQLREAGAEIQIAPRTIFQFLHYSGYSPAFINPHFIRHSFMLWRDQVFWEAYIREIDADIVCLNAMTLAPMARSARRAGAKVICIVQETAVTGLVGLRTAWLNHILTSWMDAVVFISQFDRDKSNCRAPIVEIIPNWVDLTCFDRSLSQDQAREKLRIPRESRVILMMGGVNKLKGTLTLVKAVKLLDIPNLVVLVAGYSGPIKIMSSNFSQRFRLKAREALGLEYQQRVLRYIDRNNLGRKIRFLGMQSSVAFLYAAADVLVFPADRPHQARPVLEAGAMAKPVVVPDFLQTREFISNGYNGLTYKPGDAESLAARLKSLLTNSAWAKSLGENNYHITCQSHSSNQNACKFQKIFMQIAGMLDNEKRQQQ